MCIEHVTVRGVLSHMISVFMFTGVSSGAFLVTKIEYIVRKSTFDCLLCLCL